MRPLSRVLKAPQCDRAAQVIAPAYFRSLDHLAPSREEGACVPLGHALPPAEALPAFETQEPGSLASASPAGPGFADDAAERRAEAESLIEESRAQVAEFLRDARQQAQAMEAQAREEGFRAGLEAAREAQHVLLADLETARAQVQSEREIFFENLEPEVVRLALAVAEKVIRQEVDLHPEIVVAVARSAILQLKEARTVRVTAHPSGAEALRQRLAESLPGGPTDVTVHASPLVSPGGCVVDSDRGSVNARLEVQMERVAAALGEGGA